jgi:hypothetical protein
MSTGFVALGFGHLPEDVAKNTVLDVTLHLDHPKTPISMGESWGSQSIGAGFTLREATESKWEPHLRACGCEWLVRVAAEERESGRIFTPEEILARKPEVIVVAEPPKPVVRAKVDPSVLPHVRKAIREMDYEEIEGLRDVLDAELVGQITREWRADLPWDIKDAYAALLMDRLEDEARPVFMDALRSPTIESRAYAACVLARDFGRFTAMMTNGALDTAKVDAEVRQRRDASGC